MNQFTIKDVENLSGIKAHTWRIWEQRYGIGMPQRKDSNHRFYDNENLKQVLRIAYLYHGGLKISKIADLDPEELRTKALESMPNENGHEFYVKELVESAIDLDEERFERTFKEALKRMGVEDAIIKILYPFQQKIGVLWLTDHVVPAQEHFTSNIIRQKLTVAIDDLPFVTENEKRTVLLFTPERERHEIPLQFIHYRLKKTGNKVINFGSNVSTDTLVEYSAKGNFSHVLFYLVTYLTHLELDDYLADLGNRFSEKEIIMTGPLVERVTKVPDNVRLLKSVDEILAFTGE